MENRKKNNKKENFPISFLIIIIIALMTFYFISSIKPAKEVPEGIKQPGKQTREKIEISEEGDITPIRQDLIVPEPQEEPGIANEGMISYRMYDINGNLITPIMALSVVQGQPGVFFLDFTVKARNIGNTPLQCGITSAEPSDFDTNLVRDIRNIGVGQATAWTSAKFNISKFEQASPLTTSFNASVNCNYTFGSIFTPVGSKRGIIELSIFSETDQSGFDVSVSPGGAGTEFCGDGVCQLNNGENSDNCVIDCPLPIINTRFRTFDLIYSSGSAIAYTGTCSNALTQYGHSGMTGTLTGTCSVDMSSRPSCGGAPHTLLLTSLPGQIGTLSGGASPSLWNSATPGLLCVCDDNGVNYRFSTYDSTDPDSLNVNNTATSFDPSKEVTC